MTLSIRKYLEEFHFSELTKFDFRHLRGDLTGGVTSAIVALPLALGFGILAYNGDPRGAIAGLYGAIFTGILASVFGGTQRQITGPTGGMTVILTTVYIQYGGPDALLGACLIAGLLQVGYGLIKAGRFIALIPYPVIVGFTNGIAILIFSQQIHLFLGAPAIGLITIGAILAAPAIHKTLPRALVGLLVGTGAGAMLFGSWDWIRVSFDPAMGTIGFRPSLDMIGAIPESLPLPRLPAVEWKTWSRLFPAGLTISLLGALETLLASVVADSLTGDRHNSNRELVGQGIGNLVAGFFGGIAGTGAIVRTNVNIRAGGVTKLSGILHGAVLLLVMIALAPLVGMIPLVVLAAVLMMTAIGMFEWEPLRLIHKTPAPDAVVMIATMTITVVSDLITAVLVGFALAGFLFVYRMSELGVTNLLEEKHARRLPADQQQLLRKHKIVAYDIEGPLFFGAAKNFVKEIEEEFNYKVIVINMEAVPVIDTTGALAIEGIVDRLNRDRKKLIIAGMRKEVRSVMHRLGISAKIGIGNFAVDLPQALRYAVRVATGETERMHMGRFLDPNLIMLDVKARSKQDLFSRMADRAVRKGFVRSKASFLKDLWDREEAGSTGLQNGVAIPHSRSGSAGKFVIMVARIAQPIEYETLDGSRVNLVFMIAASEDNEQYLQVLSLLAKTIGKPGVLERVREARNPEEIYDLLAHEFAHDPG